MVDGRLARLERLEGALQPEGEEPEEDKQYKRLMAHILAKDDERPEMTPEQVQDALARVRASIDEVDEGQDDVYIRILRKLFAP